AAVPAAHRLRALAAPYAQPAEEPIYVTPAARPAGFGVIPAGTLANYVVAHSQAGTPLAGQNVLIHLVADDAGGANPPP
ncbi:MAG: hypothetical protein JSR54_17915, partial [Proteobacteria bacterium]|nr:hypothetical protein [Pseudomonadota bacterium]